RRQPAGGGAGRPNGRILVCDERLRTASHARLVCRALCLAGSWAQADRDVFRVRDVRTAVLSHEGSSDSPYGVLPAWRPHDGDDVFLVCDAMTGQDAVNSSKAFNDALALNGVILTKLDGDARGGAALSIRHVTGVPIKLMGVGEKMQALEEFAPERIAQRILGHGDV